MEQLDEREKRRVQLSKKIYYDGQGSSLNLSYEGLTDEDIDIIVEDIGISQGMNTLRIENNGITPKYTRLLLQISLGLKSLTVSSNQVDEQTIKEISESERSLYALRIKSCPYAIPLTLSAMVGSKWGYLTQLRLSGVSPQGWKNLTRTEMPIIRQLQIGGESLNDWSLLHLIKCQWDKLQTIQFFMCKITRQALATLKKANWRSLKYLNLRSLDVSEMAEADYFPNDFARNCKVQGCFRKKLIYKDGCMVEDRGELFDQLFG